MVTITMLCQWHLFFFNIQVKKEEKNIRRSVLNSVVGTLDLSIRQFLRGETYPGVQNLYLDLTC